MRIIILSSLVGILFCFSTYKIAAQCSCEPDLSLKEHFKRSDAVFVAKVVEVQKVRRENSDKSDVFVKFEVTQSWKQDLKRFVTVKEINGSIEGFESNKEWLLYAFKDKDGTFAITRHCCSRTKLLSTANKQGDVKAFKKMGEKPKNIIEKN